LVAATSSFNTTVLVLGGLLVAWALVAAVARRSFLSLTAVFVVGFVLGPRLFEVLRFDRRSGFVSSLATVALIVSIPCCFRRWSRTRGSRGGFVIR
jgi:sodium/hydrogen antiporter